MKQDFKYEEEDFSVTEEDSKRERPATVDELLKEAEEEKQDFKKIFQNRKFVVIGIVLIASVIVIVSIICLIPKKTEEPQEEEENIQEVNGDISFDENGFIVLDNAEPEEDLSFKYSADDIKILREAGYTTIEIEEFERLEVTNMEALIEDITEQKKKSILENYRIFLRDAQGTGNEEYLYALANTWLGLLPQELEPVGEVEDYYKDSCNADYWKLPLQGYQPMLKVKFIDKMDRERTVFMAVEPSSYVSLRESGNIVISYNYVKAYGCEFITNIQEVL